MSLQVTALTPEEQKHVTECRAGCRHCTTIIRRLDARVGELEQEIRPVETLRQKHSPDCIKNHLWFTSACDCLSGNQVKGAAPITSHPSYQALQTREARLREALSNPLILCLALPEDCSRDSAEAPCRVHTRAAGYLAALAEPKG